MSTVGTEYLIGLCHIFNMKKQKILVIANGIFGKRPGLSGGDVRFLEIVRRWHKDGHEIHLLSSREALAVCRIFGFSPIMHVIDGPDEASRTTFITRALQTSFHLPKSLDSFTKGIIYSVNDSVFDSIPAFKLKLRHRNTICWAAVIHWLPPFPPWKRKRSTLFNSVMFYINERISVTLIKYFADALLAVSDTTLEQLRTFGVTMNKVHSVKCGVNFDEVRAILKNVHTKIYDAIFMKRAQPVKGIFDFVDIWKRVVAVFPNAKLLIVGVEGNEEKLLKEQIRQAHLERNMHSVGDIQNFTEKFTYMAQSKLFVLPSYEENWAIVIGEAMASGVPVVAYELRELRYVWSNYVTWSPVGDSAKFAERIIELLKNSKKREQMKIRGMRFIRSFDWNDIAKDELLYILSH